MLQVRDATATLLDGIRLSDAIELAPASEDFDAECQDEARAAE